MFNRMFVCLIKVFNKGQLQAYLAHFQCKFAPLMKHNLTNHSTYHRLPALPLCSAYLPFSRCHDILHYHLT